MISQIAERVTQFDVEALCAGGYCERTPERPNCCNGYREWPWDTRASVRSVKTPKLRNDS